MADNESQTVDETLNWYVAYTNPRREADVKRFLKQMAFSSFVPAMTFTRRRRTVSRPVFPRYVFVGLEPDQTLLGLAGLPGLEGMVRSCGQVITLPGAALTEIEQAEATGAFDFTDDAEAAKRAAVAEQERAEEREAFQRACDLGVAVEVVEGAWRYFTGTVCGMPEGDRINVLLKICGKSTSVPIPFRSVRLK